jgi:ribonuclease HI
LPAAGLARSAAKSNDTTTRVSTGNSARRPAAVAEPSGVREQPPPRQEQAAAHAVSASTGQRPRLRAIVRPMPWVRMRFRDQMVWIRADDAGRPVLDRDGRAEMKYRENDPKSYRPSPANLLPDDGGGGAEPAPIAEAPAPRRQHAVAKSGGPAVEVWTDGACSGNPGPMGIGVVVIDGTKRREVGEYLGVGTNNIAELTAIERGLDLADEVTGSDRQRRIRVHSDSGYAIGLLDKGWKAKANVDLVQRLRRQVAEFSRLEFVKVPGHAGVPENERCDELARAAIMRASGGRA